MTTRRAVVVRGGWEGHSPVEATDLFIPYLKENGYEVTVSDTTAAYLELDGVDLVVQCVTMSEIENDHFKGLEAAIRRGTGFAGWHGGIADSFRKNADYSFITGGQFISHPHGYTDYRVDIVPEQADNPIVDGIEHFDVHTEQYYVHYDPTNTVLATTTFASHPDYPWIEGAVMPVVWTRTWGEGKVFVCTVGHKLDDLETPEVRTIIERGLLWASK